MARCGVSLVVLVALAGLAAGSPVPQVPRQDSSPAARSLLDLLESKTTSLPPSLADPAPIPKHTARHGSLHAAARAAAGDPYRLSKKLRPILYQIELSPDLSAFTFSGESLIVINCVESTDEIVMHSKELTIDQSSIRIEDSKSGDYYTSVSRVNFDTVHDLMTIKLADSLVAGGRYLLDIKFTGILNDDLDGFYRSSYKTSSGETRWIATTQFEATGARRAFPCFDEPSFKSRYYIMIDRDPQLTAVSNMPIDTSEKQDSGKIQDTFDATLPMSSYLVAFIVSDFGTLTNANQNFTLYARQDLLSGGQFSEDIGQRALSLLGDFFSIPYSLPKEDQAAIPDFSAGAMENWGLVTYREEYLIEQDTQTIRIAEYMMTTICHELGHQWTGDLVTLDWWSHTWLNEGFADYLENYICDQIKPEWHLRDKAVVADHHAAMEYDAQETEWAMSSPVLAPEAESEQKFDRISYAKGGAVIRMWENFLGVDVLRKGMKRYLDIHMFKNTNPEDLFHAIDFEAQKAGVLPDDVSFADIARSWTEQPGVPVVNAVRDYDYGSMMLTHERFFYAPPNRASLVDQRWYVPITVVEQPIADWSDLSPTLWLRPRTLAYSHVISRASKDQWVLVNPKQIGYYRVNYDAQNWKLLADALDNAPDQIPSASRAQLINDALALARAGKLDYAVALPLFNFLKQERQVAPWQAGVSALLFLRTKLAGTEAFLTFLTYMKQLTDTAYTFVKYSGSQDHETRYLRYYVVSYACYSGNADCISNANDQLKGWLAGTTAKLDADTASVTYCYGLRGQDAASNFAGLKSKWLAETDATKRTTLMQSLMCAQDETLIDGLLSDAINDRLSISKSEVVNMWTALLNRPEQVQLLFDFAKDNYLQIDSYIGSTASSSGAISLLSKCIESITSPEQLTDARWWVEDNYKGKAGYDALQKAFLDAYVKLDWYRSYYTTVANWLRTATSSS